MNKLYFLLIVIISSVSSFGQKEDFIIEGKKIGEDTMPHINIDEIYIYKNLKYEKWWTRWKYKRLIHNVKVVYPYAKFVRYKFAEMEKEYRSLKTEKEKRQYMNKLEKELLRGFEDDLKSLTITQGRILIKLIDRETGHTSYEILKDYKGSVSAFFWQTLAKLFGSDLKSGYDAMGDDRTIEEIIFLIEMGVL